MNYCPQIPVTTCPGLSDRSRWSGCLFGFLADAAVCRTSQPVAAVADRNDSQRLAVVPMVVALTLAAAIEASEKAWSLKQALPDCLRYGLVSRPRFSRLRMALVRQGDRLGCAFIGATQAKNRPRAAASYRVAALAARLFDVAVAHLRHHPRFFRLTNRRASRRLNVVAGRSRIDFRLVQDYAFMQFD